MSKVRARIFSKEFKHSAVSRMHSGENVSALARELSVRRKLLYEWRDAFRAGGAAALRSPGRPRKGTLVEGAKGGASRSCSPSTTEQPKGVAPDSPGNLAAAKQRIAVLERKIGQQALEADFFAQALRQVAASACPSDRSGGTPSTLSSGRGDGGKAAKKEA